MRETNTKGVFHEYDPMQRGHRVFITQEAVDYFYEAVMGKRNPTTNVLPQHLAADAVSACIAEQYKHRIEADKQRLKYFKRKFGPQFTAAMLPRGV